MKKLAVFALMVLSPAIAGMTMIVSPSIIAIALVAFSITVSCCGPPIFLVFNDIEEIVLGSLGAFFFLTRAFGMNEQTAAIIAF